MKPSAAWPCALIGVLLAIALCGSASAAVYWADSGRLGVANLDGSYPTYFWSGVSSVVAGSGCGVAIDSQHIYWASYSGDAIARAGLDASAPEPTFIQGAGKPCGVAVDAQHVYWANTAGSSIGRANIDGSNPQQDFIGGLDQPCGVAVDGSHVYWADNRADSIGRANLNGSQVEPFFIEGLDGACGVAVDGAHVFWGTYLNSIGRANLDGSIPDAEFIGGLERPCGVASNGSSVFWSEQGEGGSGGRVGVAGVDGSAVNRNLVTGTHSPCGVAVDARVLYPDHPVSAHFELGKVRHEYRKGFAFIPVSFPAAGRAILHNANGTIARFLPERSAAIDLAGPGTKWVKLALDRKTATGRRLQRRLQRLGRVRTGFGLEYSEADEKAAWRQKQISLLFRRPRR